jgi:hypothetical protein
MNPDPRPILPVTIYTYAARDRLIGTTEGPVDIASWDVRSG